MSLTRCFDSLLLALAAFSATISADQPPRAMRPNADSPNVVLVMADDQGWGDVGYHGHGRLKTPFLDEAATKGLRFDRFYAAAPVCSPTRASVLTGRHPNRMGCFKWGHWLRPQEITIAEALRDVGYQTGHFGKWHVGSVQRGSPVNPGASGFEEWLSAPNFFDNDPILSRQGQAVALRGESSQVTVDAALEFIESCVANDQKFLCVVWFGSPHSPHRALDEDRQQYAEQPSRLQHFYGEITAMDRAFGQLRTHLERLGVRNNTLLWYTSDNGALPNVGSAGPLRGHKGQLFDGGLLVPAFIEWPQRISRPRVCHMRCNSADIYPTLLELCQANPASQPTLDGISLVDVIKGDVIQGDEMIVRPRAMGFWDYPARGISTPSDRWMRQLLTEQQAGQPPADPTRLRLQAADIKQQYPLDRFPGHAAWIDGAWKLHRIEDATDQTVVHELYNLGNDPNESHNLAAQHPERIKNMESALLDWQTSVIASLNGADY